MEQNTLAGALSRLSERLKAIDQGAGHFCGYISTSKGITLKMARKSIFLYHSFITKLLYTPELVSEDELKNLHAY